MNTALLVILIVIGNLALYWLLFGEKKFKQKCYPKIEVEESVREKTRS